MKENMKEHLNLNTLQPNEKGELVIVHREDDAVVVHYDEAVGINGTITAPRKFLEERGASGMAGTAQQEVKRSNILFSMRYPNLFIKFTGPENHPIKYTVTGTLQRNPDLDAMQLKYENGKTPKTFNSKELSQHLRFNRSLFADKDQNLEIVQKLQTWRQKIQKEIEASFNNSTGDKRELYEVKVLDGEKPLVFSLVMPIFVGQPVTKFQVEVMVDIRDREVSFWLESPELTEALRVQGEEIMHKELAFFEGKGYVIIEQ